MKTTRSLFLRGVEDREWSLKLELAPKAGVKHIGYKVGSDETLDELAALPRDRSFPIVGSTNRIALKSCGCKIRLDFRLPSTSSR